MKKEKDILLTITGIFLVFFVAVFGWVWADRNYKSDFWPNFWYWCIGIAAAVILFFWLRYWSRKK